ncbi:glycoside hydrolase family 43 protein [Pedobacter sandarakinus]|uniref:glycoside hydrolase family 43 protein n=1 Tax=Pedobacter sandarakinus TaxID=353156 RepID=UPI0022479E7C|nr:glycoside hydrolase family 43 protein [Pedobacter sandarakinus]MCX2574097.1 glycoside hydrolase family 43 protein [Pedobacter sandarakinus]
MQNSIKPISVYIVTLLIFFNFNVGAQNGNIIRLADPTIFAQDNTYYLYGTMSGNSPAGFDVYTSKDLFNWTNRGMVLTEGSSFGHHGFWAPQVIHYHDKFYMAYVADEHIAIAAADSPLGPFKQTIQKPISSTSKMIDPFLFIENDLVYLYYVKLQEGNRIFVAEMEADLSALKEETARACVSATMPWENTASSGWPVTEGPTVIKKGKYYYLLYSANDFRNPNYAVGFATSTNPLGPWVKHGSIPFLSRLQTKHNGSGHGDLLTTPTGLKYVFHTHEDESKVGRRKTAIISVRFTNQKNEPDSLSVKENSFRYLVAEKP